LVQKRTGEHSFGCDASNFVLSADEQKLLWSLVNHTSAQRYRSATPVLGATRATHEA
jgi:hypothetical protein